MANKEHLAIFKQGVEVWNDWRANNPEIEPDLSGEDLSGITFCEADRLEIIQENAAESKRFFKARTLNTNLIGINLSQTNLSQVNLCRTGLLYANLNWANLINAKLAGTDLKDAKLYQAQLINADLRCADLDGARLVSANLSFAKLMWAEIREANLKDGNLSQADLTQANLKEAKALAANFSGATLTGACLENWHYDSATNFDGVICDYVYLKQDQQGRLPINRDGFVPGEFTKLFQKARETLNLIFHNGIEWDAFAASYKKLLIENEELHFDIKTIDNRDGVLVVTVQGIPEAYQGKWQSAFRQEYDLALQALEARYQSELRAKDGQIVFYETMSSQQERTISQHEKTINHQAGFIDQLIKQRDNPVLRDINIHASQNSSTITNTTTQSVMSEAPKYDMRGSNFQGGFAETNYGKMVETQYNIMSQDLPKAADQIQQRLGHLIQTHKYTPEDAKHKVASDLAQEVQRNPTLKQKLMKLLQYVRDAAANGLIGEAAVEVIKLALNAVGMPVP